MQLTSLDDFGRRIEAWGMRWPAERDSPRFGERDEETAWPWPGGATRGFLLAEFILDAIDASALGTGTGWYVLPALGRWRTGDLRDGYRVRDALVGAFGIPNGFEGAPYFDLGERDQLAALVFARSIMVDLDGLGDATDDIWVYPAHGEFYLHFWHEERTCAMGSEPETLRRFDAALEEQGWTWLRDPEKNP